ncbi:MAG: hypothetical protein AB1813_22890 [Verrucomicrobiota bacterium]
MATPARGGLCDAHGNGQSGVALTLCHRSPKMLGGGAMVALWSAPYGVRWQNEVATALWPRRRA